MDMQFDIVIDPTIRSFYPPLRPTERANLRNLLQLEGFKEDLVVWSQGNVLLDGHARFELAVELGIEPRVRLIDLPDREAAIQFVIARQLGRRNLLPIATAYYIGKLYESMKRQGNRTDLTSSQSGKEWTDERLAREYGVSPRTVTRNYDLAVALDTVAKDEFLGEAFRARVLSGEARFTRRDIAHLAKMCSEEKRRYIEKKKKEREAARQARLERARAAKATKRVPVADPRQDETTSRPAAETDTPTPDRTPNSSDRTSPSPKSTTTPTPYPTREPVVEPIIVRPALAAGAEIPESGEGAVTIEEEKPDEEVLKGLTGLWSKANETTRMAFLGLPAVHAAARRMVLGQVSDTGAEDKSC